MPFLEKDTAVVQKVVTAFINIMVNSHWLFKPTAHRYTGCVE